MKQKGKLSRGDIVLILLFVMISLILIINHEPWADEAHHWLVARDSSNFASMISRMGYEGTPGLWDTIQFPFAQAGFPYFTMSLIHFLIALATIIIFLKFSPFNRTIKTLFVFGYFVLYEYNVIARNYAISVLLLFLLATIYRQRFKTWMYPFLILLLSNTNIHSLVISLVLFAEYGLTFFTMSFGGGKRERKKSNKKANNKTNKKVFFMIILMLLGFLVPIFQLLPGLDSEKEFDSDLSIRNLGKIPGPVIGAFLPIPKIQPDFWGTKLLYNSSPISVAFGMLVFLISLILLSKFPRSLFIYLFSCLGLFAIYLIVSVGGPRHHGFLFIIFIFSAWIALQENVRKIVNKAAKMNVRKRAIKNINLFLIIILITQVLASIIAGYYEINYNFSNSKRAAVFLTENNLINDETMIATYYSSWALSILPYLDKDYRFYCLSYSDYCSHTTFAAEFFEKEVPNLAFFREDITKFENSGHKNHLLILTDPYFMVFENYELLVSFEEAITKENYYIYKLTKNL